MPQAYELRWRIANPGFLSMKAAQRFMRPVKEMREGFAFVDDCEEGLVSSAASMSSGVQPHVVSATRHFAEQYRSRAMGAGLLPSSPLSPSPRSSRAVSPRKPMLASASASASALQPDASLASRDMGLTAAQADQLQGAASLLRQQPV